MCLAEGRFTVLRVTDSPNSREIICFYVLLVGAVVNSMGFATNEQIAGELQKLPTCVLSQLHVVFTFEFTATI